MSVKPQVFAHTMASLHLRPLQPFIDPNVDLARVKRPLLGGEKWIIPLRPVTSGPHQAPSGDELNKSASASAG